ncbi:hypothetical protein Dsin_003191 [Dipteronia sinensis]|uniref:Small auxin up regulated protein n=1 Tax=Dipteronia sinensis TaxID=43782 RepID=A0AAE0ELY9_9ROSI|nr:hypothetical protein Dsin_003191 [Dipteronia sinensis]
MVINPKKLIKMARKWQRLAALRRKSISLPGFNTSATMADKGHFVVYTTDRRRFTFPISYLSNHIFQELLKISEDEFGLPSNGPITLPCDAVFMEYAVSLIQGCVDRNLQEALLTSIAGTNMISPKKLIRMAKKWQKLAARNRKRISFPRANGAVEGESCSTTSSSMAEKGHFVVYSADQMRFMIPLKYLENNIIRELFKMAEDEFGLPSSRPITLPCDAVFVEYAISLIRRSPEKDIEKALLMSLTTSRCIPSSYLQGQEQNNQQSSLICSF